jgi:hypothetical protein
MGYLAWIIISVLSLILGIFIGIWIGIERMRKAIEKCSVGRLRIDHSESDEPTRMFTELRGVTPDMIAQQHKYVVFEVINEDYLSHD